MFSIDSAQIDAWIVAFIYPLTRILAFIATAPLWSNAGVPGRTRLILAIAITVAITPILPAMPIVQPASLAGLWILLQQMLIGIGMGFAAKIVFSGIELAGEFIGAQMGLGFATFYDPLSSSQTPVISEFINLIALLLFLSMNGHLLGGKIFSAGLLLALPIVVALLITNVALAVLTRAAPQLNIFALGFPLTLIGGFFGLAVSLNYLATPLQNIFEFGMSAMLGYALPGK